MKFTGRIREPEKLSANFPALRLPLSGGYEEGYADGHIDGYTEGEQAGYGKGMTDGVEQGKQAEYDRFWDAYQQNGERSNYNNAFQLGWTDANFNPKYPCRPTSVSFMFGNNCGIKTIKEGTFDFSRLTKMTNMFYNNTVTTTVPPFDMTTITNIDGAFYGSVIRALVLNNVQESCVFGTWTAVKGIVDFMVTGTIGTSFNIQWAWQLTVQSAKNIILHLKNYTGTDKVGTQTLKFSNAMWTALENDGTTAPDGKAWKDYVTDTLGWNV